jgi:hypothetical protein
MALHKQIAISVAASLIASAIWEWYKTSQNNKVITDLVKGP